MFTLSFDSGRPHFVALSLANEHTVLLQQRETIIKVRCYNQKENWILTVILVTLADAATAQELVPVNIFAMSYST